MHCAVLNFAFAFGLTIIKVGRVLSQKLAVKSRLDAIWNVSRGIEDVLLPVQPMNLQPFAGMAVIE